MKTPMNVTGLDLSNYPNIQQSLQQFIQDYQQASRWVVAFSGGMDSTVLLYLLSLVQPDKIQAVYVDHQLQENSGDWGEHCARFCQQRQVTFQALKVDVIHLPRKGLEESARQARYQALLSLMETGDVLLTGHHQRDQVETFMLNLCRGSGVDGLSAMPLAKVLSLPSQHEVLHLRPLLNVPFNELQNFARQHLSSWVGDPSNANPQFSRNRIRHQVLPVVEQACPGFEKQIAKAVSIQSETRLLLAQMAQEDLQLGQYSSTFIDIGLYQSLDWLRLKNLLRFWARIYVGYTLNSSVIDWLESLDLGSQASLSARYRVSEGEWRFYRLQLHFVRLNSSGEMHYEHALSDLWSEWLAQSRSELMDDPALAGCEADWSVKPFESVRNLFSGTTSKKWFQTHGVPPWLRGRWPVLCYREEEIALLGQHSKLNKYFEVLPAGNESHVLVQKRLQALTNNQVLAWLR